MHPTGPRNASFSPYHDDDRLSDFLDDDALRVTSNAAVVFAIHVGIIFAMSGNFIVPDLKPPPPPKAVTVEIITYDPTPEPEPEPEPVVVEIKPTAPPPAAVPAPRPQPEPQPIVEPKPTPPPPPPIVEPEPEPVFTPPPPPPEILFQPEPEPLDPVVPVPPPEPIPLPEPLPEPEAQPIIEFFEPIPEPQPIPEPIIEFYEPLPEPIIEPDLIPEPIIEFYDPIVEPELDLEPLTVLPELPPTSGVIEADPLPEIIEPELLPPEIIIEFEPIVVLEPTILPEPEPITPEPKAEPEVIPLAPTVLASPEAPESREEEIRAVPQEQSDPFLDLLKKDIDSTLDDPIVTPPRGGGNQGAVNLGGTQPPSGGTRIGRTNPGAGGWSLGPQTTGPSEAYKGINLDIRCREEGRTHEDCPQYVPKNRGRSTDGSESFEGMAGTGSDRGDGISSSRTLPSRSSLGLPIGDNSINSGGPSTSAMDFQDQNFDREFVNKTLNLGPKPKGLLDVLGPNDAPPPVNDWTLNNTPAETEETNDDSRDWVLDKLPE